VDQAVERVAGVSHMAPDAARDIVQRILQMRPQRFRKVAFPRIEPSSNEVMLQTQERSRILTCLDDDLIGLTQKQDRALWLD
jgi:hypothetical protein